MPQTGPAGDRYLPRILDTILPFFRERKASLYLFGSRARGDHVPVSDYDIAVDCPEPIGRVIGLAAEALEESTIPVKVDLVDCQSISAPFREHIRSEGVLLWRN